MLPAGDESLLDGGEIKIDGIICPGHVSAIIGSKPYELSRLDMASPVYGRLRTGGYPHGRRPVAGPDRGGCPRVEIAYGRTVSPEGNVRAQELLAEIFEPQNARWRGVGEVAASGYKIKEKYQEFDAEHLFEIHTGPAREPAGCRCGDVLRGVIRPTACPLFGRACTPERPVGPCMCRARAPAPATTFLEKAMEIKSYGARQRRQAYPRADQPLFVGKLNNEWLARMDDSAVLEAEGRLAFYHDKLCGYLSFFPGGDIGKTGGVRHG